jgi:hypothetical protein
VRASRTASRWVCGAALGKCGAARSAPGASGGVRAALLVTAIAAVLAGCTSREVYQGSQGWRRSTCDGIVDPERRAACLERADRDYDAYRREREPAPK